MHPDDVPGYEFQNEFQAAYHLSQIEFRGGHVTIPPGLFAVVHCAPAYCKYTDALLPQHYRSVARLCLTRRLAEYFAKVENKKLHTDEYCGDDWFEVLPKPERIEYAPMLDDDIPF